MTIYCLSLPLTLIEHTHSSHIIRRADQRRPDHVNTVKHHTYAVLNPLILGFRSLPNLTV